MQGTIYTSGIGNVSGMDCVHIPLWITITDGRCRQLLWGVVTGFRRWRVPWEFQESPVVMQVMTSGACVTISMNTLPWSQISESGGSSSKSLSSVGMGSVRGQLL